MKNELVQDLNAYLSNVGVIYIKLHNLHWNSTGTNFKVVHEYLETLYDGFAEVLDTTAETIKIEGGTPLASMKDFLVNATISEIDSKEYKTSDALSMTYDDLETIKKQAEDLRNKASICDNYMVVSMIEDHLADYNKTIWFLEATLKA